MGPTRRRGGSGSGPAPKARASRGRDRGDPLSVSTTSGALLAGPLGWGGVGGSIS